MIIDALKLGPRSPKQFLPGRTLAEQLAASALRTTPLCLQGTSMQDPADVREPTVLWHPDVPQVAFLMVGGSPMPPWDFGLRINEVESSDPKDQVWQALCLCPHCEWSLGEMDGGDWQARSLRLRHLLGRLREGGELPQFEVYVAERSCGVPSCSTTRGYVTEWGGISLLEIGGLPNYAAERADIPWDALRSSLELIEFNHAVSF